METTTHEWVNKYEECEKCNYGTHRCHFCGDDLDHESYSYNSVGELVRHYLSDCRPDLVEHEPGELCTWGDDCYAYQDFVTRDWTNSHSHFHPDGTMA